MRVLDLFCGCGGLTLGFAKRGYDVTGVDINPHVEEIFALNSLGHVRVADLRHTEIRGNYTVVTGGPPCRPWSSVNLKKRDTRHPDHILIYRFVEEIRRLRPALFILENVPPAMSAVMEAISGISRLYLTGMRIIRYSDWGAATRRRRLFAAGIRRGLGIGPDDFFELLNSRRAHARTVRDAIGNGIIHGSDPEHIYPELRTIHKYTGKYRRGSFGWYVLRWDEPAPSFGNIMKTYILHPDSSEMNHPRVISVREALCIMGFPRDFRFPDKAGMSTRYQMVADAVSPEFSRVLAEITALILK